MKAAGVIVEYNPFHNGHAYHLEQTKKITNADVVIAAMSGSFLQRGEPAIVSKWARTKMALAGGADVVVEIPYAFSTQHAKMFARGAISILDALQVKEICFGSESGNITPFYHALQERTTRMEALNQALQQKVETGVSYPKALSDAYKNIGIDNLDLSKPNNILGFHYIEQIQEQGSNIQAHTVERLNAQYHDTTFASSSIASATSIRKHLQKSPIEDASEVMPLATKMELQSYQQTYGLLHMWENYFHLLKYKLLTMSAEQLRGIYEAEEGLENRLLYAIEQATSFENFMQAIKTKRYTWTRLQRLCLHTLTHATKDEMNLADTAPYIRLLGMSKTGQAYISSIKKNIPIPLLSHSKHSKHSHPLLDLDIRANAVYYAILPEPFRSQALKQEYVQHPIRSNI
ncbi:nucleotidyltransferase [Ectobacillus antri]|uniref:tRNA(Met) cytidine acetate ligase n=1 Tax=Ectobacillus antri TaxID=2486280 RepID=A0ABT6H1J1_9BACI|nr:nucleotidyltransferase [Ectobacillus antri]MDG4655820.1 nucleotidyltransferase [Ectobacillus antri]MDG5752495.1 nucleotidyltransferase [Ectobacillus antri]